MVSTAVALLLPGMSLNATIFPELGLPALAPDLTAVELGEDGITPELTRCRLGVYARLLDAAVSASTTWRTARRLVVGHSFGGMLALWWLLHSGCAEAARVHGLVLVATTAGPMYDRVRARILRVGNRELRVGLRTLVPLWNRRLTTRTVKRLLCGGRLDAQPVDFRALAVSSDRELGVAGWRNTDWRVMRSYRHAMCGFDVRDRLGEICVPTIVLHGTKDTLFEQDDARVLARGIPGAELRLIPGAAHALPLTHGDELVRAVRDLLAD